ncbi:MAG: exonuclease domain-containing protein [Bacteroidota bacterium]
MYTIVDIETTGNGRKGNHITEISIFKFDGHSIVDELTTLVRPPCPIPPFITGLTGIDDDMVRDAPRFADIADQVMTFTKDCVFVAHAVNFDYGVIKAEFQLLGMPFARKKLCTVRLSRKLIPGLHSYSLGKLCSSLGIPIANRHRARGDAAATVTLFEQLLQKPKAANILQRALHAHSQEATLPPHLDQDQVAQLPQQPGVYYFLDQKGTIIYVGKAKNLKKRVLGHFYDQSEHEIRLCREVARIDYDRSGGELIALLMESAAIKQHFPKFNRAQKRVVKRYAIFLYEDRNGRAHLGFADHKQVRDPLTVLHSPTECRMVLKQLSDTFQLCPRYCQLVPLQATNLRCLSRTCDSHCSGAGAIADHNAKVQQAVTALAMPKGTLLLRQPGRDPNEQAFIYIEDGQYEGYGFIDAKHPVDTIEDIRAFLIPQKATLETQRIVESAIRKMGKHVLMP